VFSIYLAIITNTAFYIKNYFYLYFSNIGTEVRSQIEKFYPATFETLTYQNYKAKFHTLLFIDEIEVNNCIINIEILENKSE